MIRVRIGALFAASIIVFAACGGATTTSSAPSAAPPTSAASTAPSTAASTAPSAAAVTPKAGGTLVVAIPGDIAGTDPALVSDASSSYVLQQIVETLVTLKPGTGDTLVPGLAEKWTVSDDGKTYTFTLRTGVKFSDGTDFNAAAVKFNFDRWLNLPKSYVDAGLTFYPDTVIGRGATANVVSTTAPDPATFTVTLKAPNSAFLIQLTLTPFGISSPKALTDGKASDPVFKNNLYANGGPPAATGTGPFMFKEWLAGDHVSLVKNPNYWNAAAGGPYLDGITYKPIADPTDPQRAPVGRCRHLADPGARGRADGQGGHQAAVLRPRQCLQHGRRGDEPEVQAVRQPQDPPGGGLRDQSPGARRRVLR